MSNNTIENQSKFVSQCHIGYGADVDFEALDTDSAYELCNITQIQVADLRVAIQICLINNIQKESDIKITSLDNSKYPNDSSPKIQYLADNQQNVFNLNAILLEIFYLLRDGAKQEQDIREVLKQIKGILNLYTNKENILSSLKDCDFSNTAQLFTEAHQKLERLCASVDEYSKQTQQDLQYKFNKDIIMLSGRIVWKTHYPLLTLILINNVKSNILKSAFKNLGGIPLLGPIGTTISILCLLYDIYDLFYVERNKSKKLKAIYEIYGAVISIYEKLDYHTVSLLNFSHLGCGNLITTKKDNIFTYHLYPNYTQSNFAIFSDHTLIFRDKTYKAKFSLDSNKEGSQSYIKRIFNMDNRDDDSITISKKNTQFSIFSFQHLHKIYDENNNITHSSAFQHMQNILLKFDNFLFIKSASFSSVLVSDMLMQSFAPSKQRDKARKNKTAIILTNCLHKGQLEYQAQQYLKDRCFSNDYTKKNILFLSAMFRIKKFDFINNIISQLQLIVEQLKIPHNADIKLAQLAIRHKVATDTNPHFIDNKKLCNMGEKDFCAFVYELCELFIEKRYFQKGKKNEIVTMINTLSEISYLMSLFNDYENVKLKDYPKIDKEYEKQKKSIHKLFKQQFVESQQAFNLFYNIRELESLYIAMLDRYFCRDNDQLDSLLKIDINYLEIELHLKDISLAKYQYMVIEYVTPLVPLHKSILNLLDEQNLFKFCRITIQYIMEAKNNNESIKNFLSGYEANLLLLESINFDIDKGNQYDSSALLDMVANEPKNSIIYEILTKRCVTLDFFEEHNKNIAKHIIKHIANELDKNNSYIRELYKKMVEQKSKHIIQHTIADYIITYISGRMLDKLFPTQIKISQDMKQKITTLMFAINRHRNTPYTTCKLGNEYLTFPIKITQTLISADVRAILLGGSALDSGFCIKAPSVAIFSENQDSAAKMLKENLKNFINFNVDFSVLDGREHSIIKEAYAKLWFYLDMGENNELESYLINCANTNPNFYEITNLTSRAYISTNLNKTKVADNRLENFELKEGNDKGNIMFNYDFLVQLKRIAEWNYTIYTNEYKCNNEQENCGYDSKIEELCGNLIYDEKFIPTTIDVVD